MIEPELSRRIARAVQGLALTPRFRVMDACDALHADSTFNDLPFDVREIILTQERSANIPTNS